MFSLKGNNVRLAAKSPVQPKAKKDEKKLNMSSPYYQEKPELVNKVQARRVKSATNCRNVISAKPKPKSIYRKQSEPIMTTPSVYSEKTAIHTKNPSSTSCVSDFRRRGTLLSSVSGESGGGGDVNWNPVRPLSAGSTSNSNTSEVFLSDIQPPVQFENLDSEELEIYAQLDRRNSPETKDRQPIDLGDLDENLLSESDNLLQDVVIFCDKIGLDSSLIDDLRKTQRSGSTGSSNNNSVTNPIEGSTIENIIDGRDADNLSKEPNSRRNSDDPFRETNYINDNEIKERIMRELNKKVQNLSRPSSACSQISIKVTQGNTSVGNNYAEQFSNSPIQAQNQGVSRIISTLRLIEEEEKKGCEMAAQFGDFFRQKLSPNNNYAPYTSPHTSRPSSATGMGPAQSSYIPSGGDFTNQFHSNVTTPRLPPITKSNNSQVHDTPMQSGRTCLSEYSYGMSQSIQYTRSPRAALPFENGSFNANPSFDGDRQGHSIPVETNDQKASNIFSFLDEVEKSDRDVLFNLKFDSSQTRGNNGGLPSSRCPRIGNMFAGTVSSDFPSSTMDTLIRKGSVELAREVILLERRIDEISQNINILEENLMSQRELNVRNIRNSQRDLKKRLKIQQEEFELALSRHQAFVDQLIAEKRGLQDKCEKVLKDSKDSEQRYQQQIKSLQEKHLDEIKRIRKLQDNAEKTRKQHWVGSKTQEIRDMTVKGLEPELQRIIQRHQQEMTEMRAWHSDELRETEERNARKQTIHLQELRETFNREKDEACRREREMAQKRYDGDLNRLNDEFESHKRRLVQEIQDERERFSLEESKLKELMQENVRKAQIKGEVELDTQIQEHEAKISNLEKRHDSELKSLKDIYENQRENLLSSHTKKLELVMAERENSLQDQFREEKEKEIKEREKKLKDEFGRLWAEEEQTQDARVKRMQDKFQFELTELEKSEMELKQKFSQVKAEVLAKEEIIFSLKTTVGLKEKQIVELNDSNMKMLEERINLTAVIRREFTTQIEALEDECRSVKTAVLELKAKQKLDLESHQIEVEKVRAEKDIEMEKLGLRVKQALLRKEEAIQEFQKQLEKAQIRINHLEQLLEQQRKDFVSSITASEPSVHPTKKK